MRAAVAAWLALLCLFLGLERSLFSAVLLMGGLVVGAWAMHAAIEMGRDATMACAVMAAGTTVWHVERDVPLVFAVLMAWAFLTPLVWRSVVVR